MIKIYQNNKKETTKALKKGEIDGASISIPNLADRIVLHMHKQGLLNHFEAAFTDKRAPNQSIPFNSYFTLGVIAKFKQKCSLTDIPYAITEAELLACIGWNLGDDESNLEKGLFTEGSIRKTVNHYTHKEMLSGYNVLIQNYILPQLEIKSNIHILDCTKVPVNLDNENYEESGIVTIDGKTTRGYKLAALRGIYKDTGVFEEIDLTSINVHDTKACENILKNSKVLKENDILIEDRGFLDRNMINYLKTNKSVNVYIPAKSNMHIFEEAVSLAIHQNKWTKHPNKKRENQQIQLVKGIGNMWEGTDTCCLDVELNACVVMEDDKKNDKKEYYVFLTTDLSLTANQIIKTYELRSEIEEDFRQTKDFWKMTKINSTKLNFIAYHLVLTLTAYLFYQIFTSQKEGERFAKKSLPVVLKNYVEKKPKSIIIYANEKFGIYPFVEFIELYASCPGNIRKKLIPLLEYA